MSVRAFEPFGRYALGPRLASGGMGEVFLAATRDGSGAVHPVIIKRLHDTLCSDANFVRLFVNEAKIAAALKHANIVRVFDSGCIDGRYFIAMEYVSGTDLARALARVGAMPTHISAFVIVGVARALAYAHRQLHDNGEPLRLVHRDVSPHNILLSSQGDVKLTDFGIAKSGLSAVRTATNQIRGRPAYLAPEHAAGRSVDGRSDLYSLGLVAYESMSGKRARTGDDPLQLLELAKRGDVPSLGEHPLSEIVAKCLARTPSARFADGDALADAVEAATRLATHDEMAAWMAPIRSPVDGDLSFAQNWEPPRSRFELTATSPGRRMQEKSSPRYQPAILLILFALLLQPPARFAPIEPPLAVSPPPANPPRSGARDRPC